MVEICRCKYLLPCGRCDKLGAPCEALDETWNMKNECEHEWRYKGKNTTGHHYECIKCGTMNLVPLENLYTATY